MIVDAAAPAKAVEIADQPLARTIAATDDALEVIDRVLDKIRALPTLA